MLLNILVIVILSGIMSDFSFFVMYFLILQSNSFKIFKYFNWEENILETVKQGYRNLFVLL